MEASRHLRQSFVTVCGTAGPQLVVLSPHLDDAAFSCGGAIVTAVRSGKQVTVVTAFAGDAPVLVSPLAQRLHRSWRLDNDVVTHRRNEDRIALRHLGAESVHWRLPEAIYRVDSSTCRPLYNELPQLFRSPHPAEDDVLGQLMRNISRLPSDATMVVPLAAGGHVDHRLVRQAAERVGVQPRIYFEDFPYSAKPGELDRVIGNREKWRVITQTLNQSARRDKYLAAASYRSQIRSQFRTRFHLRWRLWKLHRRLGGERFWRPLENQDAS